MSLRNDPEVIIEVATVAIKHFPRGTSNYYFGTGWYKETTTQLIDTTESRLQSTIEVNIDVGRVITGIEHAIPSAIASRFCVVFEQEFLGKVCTTEDVHAAMRS